MSTYLNLKRAIHDLTQLSSRFSEPFLQDEFERASLFSVEELFATLILGPQEIEPFSEKGQINTDDNLLLEFGAPLDFMDTRRLDEADRFRTEIRTQLSLYGSLESLLILPKDNKERSKQEAEIARALIKRGRSKEATLWIQKVSESGDTETIELLNQFLLEPNSITSESHP